jgi:hypothetical protein
MTPSKTSSEKIFLESTVTIYYNVLVVFFFLIFIFLIIKSYLKVSSDISSFVFFFFILFDKYISAIHSPTFLKVTGLQMFLITRYF